MNQNMNENRNNDQHDWKQHLRAWDPASRIQQPNAIEVAEMREHLAQAARTRPRLLPAIAAFAITLASAVAVFFLPTGVEHIAPTAAITQPATVDAVSMQYTASNGIRIHWSIYPDANQNETTPRQPHTQHRTQRPTP